MRTEILDKLDDTILSDNKSLVCNKRINEQKNVPSTMSCRLIVRRTSHYTFNVA